MKKAFEAFMVLIIFYGVYSAFDTALPYIFPDLKLFWIIIISLLVAAALLLLYSQIIAGTTKRKITERMKITVQDLEGQVHAKEIEIEQKDSELDHAFKIKKAVEEEVEDTL